ncbi:inverse autotransporter beta domain-containing protein, partial [Aeromonas enteropelogenes]|uniref:inverse autotransporter beta domain-containing protein n=1 Tax=Aeromonas enteropelogenes TaxID=29489 RepID=UPI003BA31B8B
MNSHFFEQEKMRVKWIAAWTALFTQLSTLVVSPIVMASAAIDKHMQLVPYSVASGDTLYGIALRHGLTIEKLLELNSRSPYQIKSNLIKVGQVIYVPAGDFQTLPILGNAEQGDINSKQDRDSKLEVFVAGQASRLGQTYGQNDEQDSRSINFDTRYGERNRSDTARPSFSQQEGDYLKSQLHSAFQSEANERVRGLLSEFGTAEVELSFDNNFRLNRYSADLLTPLVDAPERMLFVQSGGRYDNTTDRVIVNFGVGQRHFFDEWMVGYNAFFDYDVTRSHSRLGLGVEAWADYLKLSANAYSPLSGWKDSSDFDEYLERAARGFDLNVKYYLPSYPQLGVSAELEQYFGDEVDLIGSKQLERNPYAGSVGLEWQPIPLLKVGVDHRKAKGSQNDTSVSMGLEWRFGASFDDMLNPNNVELSRQLQGMRHDLVERNNNIVLEYKEKERVVTIEHADITGMSGEVMQLNPTVNIPKGHIVSWRWTASDPLLQGGLSDGNAQRPNLTLPILPPDILTSREFSLSLVVTDERGGTYQSAPIPVVVQVNPELLNMRLTVISEGSEADSIDAPEAEALIDDRGTVIEFVLTRQLKGDETSSAVVEASEVIFDVPVGYRVERLEGELIGGREEAVWVNKLEITPLASAATQVFSFHAKGPAGKASGDVNLTLTPVSAIDPAAKPKVRNLRMAGTLEVGKALSATYAFDANGGDVNDRSTYAWGNQGETTAAAASGAVVATSGVVPDYTLSAADVGEVKEISVQAKNGQEVIGNTVTVGSDGKAIDSDGGTGGGGSDTDGGADTDGDGKGEGVIDPAAKPKVRNLRMAGTLEVGKALSA